MKNTTEPEGNIKINFYRVQLLHLFLLLQVQHHLLNHCFQIDYKKHQISKVPIMMQQFMCYLHTTMRATYLSTVIV